MNRAHRNLVPLIIDAVLIAVAFYLALYLRFDGTIPHRYMLAYRQLVAIFVAIQLMIFYIFGFYNRLWQYASTGELLLITALISAGSIVNF